MYFIDEKACHATAHTALTGFVMLSFAVLSDRMAMHGLQIEEAKARFDSILNDSSDHGRRYSDAAKAMKVDFVCTHDIGDKVWAAGPPYDCVSCMFALHYFFHSEDTARRAVEMAAKNLKHGGHFIGVLPNARHVMDTIGPDLRSDRHRHGGALQRAAVPCRPCPRLPLRWPSPWWPPEQRAHRIGAGRSA